jgi:hypothetical protein
MVIRALFPLAVLPAVLLAQTTDHSAPAVSYEERYREVRGLEPRADRVALVTKLVLKRDVAQFSLASGALYLLSPVGGRTVGAVFQGEGTFSFSPPTRIEQDRLARFQKSRSLEVPFTELVLLFADTTFAEVEGKLAFGPGKGPGDLGSLVRESLDYLGEEGSKSFDPDLMAAFLNQESNDLFYALINRDGGGPLMFMLNPFEFEGVILARRAPRTAWTNRPEVICRFPSQGAPPAAIVTSERRGTASIRDYRMEITLTQTGTGDLRFVAAARLEITTATPVGPWVPFELFSKLSVDSARWDKGGPATVFRGKDGMQLWIRLDGRLQPGEIRAVLLYYFRHHVPQPEPLPDRERRGSPGFDGRREGPHHSLGQ